MRPKQAWLTVVSVLVFVTSVLWQGMAPRSAACSSDVSCQLANGCGGTRLCDGIRLGPCIANGGTLGSKSCTSTRGCGGLLNCTDTGSVIGCQPTNLAACGEICNGLDDDGDGVVDDGVGPQGCTNNCGSGTQTCVGGAWTACNVAPVMQPCSNSATGCGGNRTCTNNVWSPCGCTDNSSSAGCQTTCGTAGSGTCNADCTLKSPCKASFETCNNCDDTGDGQIDEGLHCSCDL